MSRKQHLLYGDPKRFQVVADFVISKYSGTNIKYVADVAGGKGLLTRGLMKKGNFICELIEPRQNVLKGIPHRMDQFSADMADYYDLLIGLHPDEALRELAKAALIRPVVLIPCCNFWDEQKRSQKELIETIESFYKKNSISFERITMNFEGPKNIAIVSEPS
ncbi:hypothetical protein FJZ33_07040 [Candidatus Poribacteria bacterium]|nr:hypothetical protein [Candidatus Poribacteria bacterium]